MAAVEPKGFDWQKRVKKLKKERQISSGTILIRKISDLAKTTKFVFKELNA
jgi:hypothetical protein